MLKRGVPPNALFDYIIANKGMANDSAISRKSGVMPPNISKIRSGGIEVSDFVRVALMRAFNLSLTKLDELAPPAVKGEKK